MKNIRKLFKEIDKVHPGFSVRVIITNLILGFLPLINIFAPKLIIDELMGQKRFSYCLGLGALVLILSFIKEVTYRGLNNYLTLTFEDMSDKLTFKIAQKSLRLPIEKSDSKEIQDMMEQAHYAVWEMYTLYDIIVLVISAVITGILSLGILVRLNPAILILLLLLILINKKLVKLIKENELKYQENNISDLRSYRFFSNFAADLRYFKDIGIYDGQDLVLEKADYYQKEMIKSSTDYFNKNGIYTGIMNVSANGSIILTLIYLTYKLIDKTISLANFTMYFNSLIQVINATNLIQQNYAKVISVNAQLKVFFDFLEMEEGLLDKGHIDHIDTSEVRIRFDNVSFKYPASEDYVLKDATFEIKNGETVALVGKNGAGKSTIVKLLCKFYEPSEGNIYLNDINIKDINTKEYYKILSPTFQDFRLFPFRISENITGMLKDEIEDKDYEKMDKSFDLLKLASWIDKLVDKEDTFLTYLFSDESVEPSGGIGQKLALARSMYHEGKFFIMDEPTSALDPRSEEEIFENMLKISKGQTSLFISHRLSSTKYADKIIVCDKGCISEEGSHEELMKKDGLYKEMFTSQADLYL
ncbi:Lipid A export ATP-binding/permease protein MsbA [Anaerococcus prevotii]|uniref:ABC transporter related n=1 Tax=Anaerococcus prevotii (strain ATCC 9321 / DSM 20548 / JCM 6508 / NCTC 11806 / PC1) TaxID=525919 RepID=C7RDF1_ANAPD|nr:ABC transporter ATP-binding protein [Anaerococcus prevotii]ACV29214.1 ABC transporter related [Anaerococcus prevotii DSM 20548]SUU94889.1 Lipid A export ATP-binding/permease protein MsbA [Anaerococcus prevotii]